MLEIVYSLTSSVTLVIFAVTFSVLYVIITWRSHSSDLPPMPCLPVPFFGHILFLKPSKREALMKWRKRTGDIFSFYIGSKLVIAIGSYKLLHESFIKQSDKFSDRPSQFLTHAWKENAYGITFNSGQSWKEQRSVSLSILRSFGMGRNWLAEKITQEVEAYIRAIDNLNGEVKDLAVLTRKAASNVICAILVGNRFDYDHPFFEKFVKQSGVHIKLFGMMDIADAFPWVRFLPGDRFGAKLMLKMTLSLNQMFSEKFINDFKESADDTSTDNFIKAYFREMNHRKDGDLNETHLRRIVDSLFIGGTDTTSQTVIAVIGLCILYPEWQKKMYEEILEHVGAERLPTMQDKLKLKNLNAFTLETQRLVNIGENGSDHKCSKTTYVGGYRIPEGAIVVPFLDAVMKDERVWKDPYAFRPERFLDKDGNIFIPDEFLPFSLGRRVCLGESLAKMELFLFSTVIIQRFELLPESPNSLPLLGNLQLPFKVRMRARTHK